MGKKRLNKKSDKKGSDPYTDVDPIISKMTKNKDAQDDDLDLDVEQQQEEQISVDVQSEEILEEPKGVKYRDNTAPDRRSLVEKLSATDPETREQACNSLANIVLDQTEQTLPVLKSKEVIRILLQNV